MRIYRDKSKKMIKTVTFGGKRRGKRMDRD